MFCDMSMVGYVVQTPYVQMEEGEEDRIPFAILKLHAKYRRTLHDGNVSSWCQYVVAKFMGDAFKELLPYIDDGRVDIDALVKIHGAIYPAYNRAADEMGIGCEVRRFKVLRRAEDASDK